MHEKIPSLQEMAESTANLQAILNTVVDAIVTIDERGIMLSANPATIRMFGYDRGELIGHNVSRLMPFPYRSEHDQYIARYLETGESTIIGLGREVVGQRKDGTVFPIDLAVSEVVSGPRRMFTGIIRDMTDRRQAETALHESQRRLTTLMTNLPGAAYRSRNDCTWSIEFISDGCLDLTGYTAAQLMSGSVTFGRHLIHPDDKASVQARVQQDLANGRPFHVVYRIRHLTRGIRWIWEQGRGISNEAGKIEAIEGFLTDITQQHETEERLVQSARLAAIGQMVTGLAHESRNALQRACACLDMLSLDLLDRPRQLALTERIQSALDELQRLFEEVRGYASPVHLSLGPCNLADVWRLAWQHVVQMPVKSRVSIIEHRDGVDATCVADRYRMEQVFRNIFENAVAVSPEEGHVLLHCREANLGGKPALCVAVTDEGPGMTDDQIERVFEPFYTTKQKGTGLGLPISQRIMEAHGGSIRVVSSASAGATVEIVMPRSP